MAWMTAAAIVGTSLLASDAAGNAADTQAAASREASATQAQANREAIAAQKEMFNKQVALQEPWRQSGITAQNRLMQLLGLSTGKTYDQYRQELLPTYTTTTTPAVAPAAAAAAPANAMRGIFAGGNPFGAGGGHYETVPNSSDLSGETTMQVWVPDSTSANRAVAAPAAPVTSINEAALDQAIRDRMAADQAVASSPDFGKYARDFSMADFQADPGYAFRLSEGQKALDRQAAARGGLISGAALKAATRYGQDMGSQEYQNAYNRYQTNRSNQLNPLQSLAGVGQTSTNALTGAAGQLGSSVGSALSNTGSALASGITDSAAARASGYVGQANAMTQGLGTYLNYSNSQNMMNALRQNQYGQNYGQFTPGSSTFVGPMPQ